MRGYEEIVDELEQGVLYLNVLAVVYRQGCDKDEGPFIP